MRMQMKYGKHTWSKKITILVLVSAMFLLTLTGCNNSESGKGGELALIGEQIVTPEEAKKTTVFTVQDDKLTLDTMYLYYIQYIFNEKLTAEAATEAKISEINSAVVSQMMMESVEYQLAMQMDEIEVTEEMLAESKKSAENFYNFFGKDLLAHYGVDKESVEALFEKQTYVTQVTNKAIDDLAADRLKEIEEDYKDTNFHSITYALFPSVVYSEDGAVTKNEDGSNVMMSEEQMKEQLAKAQELQKRAAAGEKTMEELIEEYGITFCSGVERNYEGAYEDNLNKVVKELEEGQISDVIETTAGYMVARMDKKNDEEYKEYMINYAAKRTAQDLVPKMQEKWAEQADLNSVKVDENIVNEIAVKEICTELEAGGYYNR